MEHDSSNPSPFDSPGHLPVLGQQVVRMLSPAPGEVCFDGTLGRAGHARLIMPHLAPGGRYIGVDLDLRNVAYVSDAPEAWPVPIKAIHASFTDAISVLADESLAGVDMLLADLGFASTQMDDPARGFSFQNDGPLDMRLNTDEGPTAADMVQELPEAELADVIYRFGEERLSRVIARKIIEARRNSPILTTRQLAELCAKVYGSRGRRQRIHPATRTFMALRIAVNNELAKLDELLAMLPKVMNDGGRVVIISFHSLEDRAVKYAFRDYAQRGNAELLTKKPLTADDQEQMGNPRSRSAKLRAIRWNTAGASAKS